MSFRKLNFRNLDFREPKLLSGFKAKPWGVTCLESSNWKKAKRKILLVLNHLPSEDLKNKRLFSENDFIIPLLDKAWEKYSQHEKNPLKHRDFAFAIVSYNWFRTNHLDAEMLQESRRISNTRIESIIDRMRPTDLHFFGSDIAEHMYGLDPAYRGWVSERKTENHSFRFSFNISITDNFSRNKTNLANYMCEYLSCCFLGYNPFSLQHLKPGYRLVNTLKDFDRLMKKLWKADFFAYDLETTNLSVHNNRILTIQVTLDREPDLSYIILLKHMDSPFDKAGIIHIMMEFHRLLSRKLDHEDWNTPYIIGQNLMFDMMVSRIEFGIPVVEYRLYDTMAGEYLLDENTKFLNTSSSMDTGRDKPFSLDNIFCRYENDFYKTAGFSKKDRVTIEKESIYKGSKHNKAFLEYMAMDTISVMHIHFQQFRKAGFLRNGKKNYRPVFRKLALGLYSDTIHVMSEMKENGLHADRNYIVKQVFNETSDVLKEKTLLIKKLRGTEAVAKAENILKKQLALPVDGGLFKGSGIAEKRLFDITKESHQQLLFFKVLGLEPVGETKTGYSVGAEFSDIYSRTDEDGNPAPGFVKEVKLFADIKESTKVMGYFKNFYKKIYDPDGKITDAIHASYGFAGVVTGRSNSFDPSLQQNPNHGQYAKILKRSFTARENTITIKLDYSTNEIACWAVLSGDGNLAATLRKVWDIKLGYRLDPSEKKQEKNAACRCSQTKLCNIFRYEGQGYNSVAKTGLKGDFIRRHVWNDNTCHGGKTRQNG